MKLKFILSRVRECKLSRNSVLRQSSPLSGMVIESRKYHTGGTVVGREVWTEERVTRLKDDWAAGLSGTDIANRLGCGLSRNAVIGKIHRLGLSGRVLHFRRAKPRTGDNIWRKKNRRNRLRTIAEYMEAARLGDLGDNAARVVDVDVPVAERIQNLDDLEPHHCRWPYGDNPFTFCGRPKMLGKSYCPGHVLQSMPAPKDAPQRPPISRSNHSHSPFAGGKDDPLAHLYVVDTQTMDIAEKEPA